jgi:hypothetical protein
LSERGSSGVTPISDSQPLDVPRDRWLSCHVANYKAWYKLLCLAPVMGLSHKLCEKEKKRKEKTHKNLPKNQAPLSSEFFQAPLMEEGGGRGVFGNGNSQNNPLIYHPCLPLTAIDRFLYAC